MSRVLGVAASGHEETSKAAKILLEEGGNAFDAALGAMCAACVCEPMLASLGGGGFLLAQAAGDQAEVFDFFTQTPSARTGELDFYPIQADFGTDTGTPAGDGLEFVPMHHLAGDGHAPEAYFVHDEAGNKRDEIRHDLDELQNRLDEIDLQIEQKRK